MTPRQNTDRLMFSITIFTLSHSPFFTNNDNNSFEQNKELLFTLNSSKTMIRPASTPFFVFFYVLVAIVMMTQVEETQGLASVARTVRQGLWGRLTSRVVGRPAVNNHHNSDVPAAAIESIAVNRRHHHPQHQVNQNVGMSISSALPQSSEVPTLQLKSSSSLQQPEQEFDADSYRRQMTDLVYERSMQRFLQ